MCWDSTSTKPRTLPNPFQFISHLTIRHYIVSILKRCQIGCGEKNPLLNSILSQINPLHILTLLLEGISQVGSLIVRFPDYITVCTSHPTSHACYMSPQVVLPAWYFVKSTNFEFSSAFSLRRGMCFSNFKGVVSPFVPTTAHPSFNVRACKKC
jgi:hypothetical protein